MADLLALKKRNSDQEGRRAAQESTPALTESPVYRRLNSTPNGIEALLTTQEASQVLKIHPKVLERMAKRGEVPALKIGKFWRYRATALDAWINSRLQSKSQVCRIATSF